MGCDIHIWAERKSDNGYDAIEDHTFSDGSAPFNWRDYGMFGFLADVRNYSAVPPMSEPRGLPDALSDKVREEYSIWGSDAHSASWLSVKELSDFNYDAVMEDRRTMVRVSSGVLDGGCTADEGDGKPTTFRAFLGNGFMSDLAKLRECGADRVVFWFDN